MKVFKIDILKDRKIVNRRLINSFVNRINRK